jgi:integrase
MARRGQVGSIEISGKWYVVRFWKYPIGQDRVYASEKICPTDNKAPGYLPKGERRCRANEIVASSGVNDLEKFVASGCVTFREQAEWFLSHSVKRNRRPAKPATVANWRCCVDRWLNPNLGELPLASINNGTVKTLVAKMHAAKLAAQTMTTYVNLVKLIVGSAIDDNGEQLFPRKWNNEFIDLPVIENQHQPTFTPETMTAIVKNAAGQEQVLYSLLAGTGLRVGEALGLEVKHLSADCRTLTVEQSCWAGDLQIPKTKSAYRQIDVCTQLAALLKQFVGERHSGLVFTNLSGRPLSQTNLIRRSLHPILEEIGVAKAGFHAMRRFRTTWLRKQRAPEDLVRYWLGHAKQSTTDGYSMLAQDVDFRQEVAEKLGAGFGVPASMTPMTPMTPRKSVKKETEIVVQVAVPA